MSPFPQNKGRWLLNSEAAHLLCVTPRTIKRWLANAATRDALSAVRHGKQWRIPRPVSIEAWEIETAARLKNLTRDRKNSFDQALKNEAKRFARCRLESFRIWLAVYAKAVTLEKVVSREARKQMLLLFHAALEILDAMPRYEMDAEKVKELLPERLRSRRCSASEVQAIMKRWPEANELKHVREARTLTELEKLHHSLDLTEALRELEKTGQNPTDENLRSLLHKDIVAHINDTREKLPASSMDMRTPQHGLSRYMVRKRHPLKHPAQKKTIGTVYDIRDRPPGAGDLNSLPIGRKSVPDSSDQ